jgi:hypothetical protein
MPKSMQALQYREEQNETQRHGRLEARSTARPKSVASQEPASPVAASKQGMKKPPQNHTGTHNPGHPASRVLPGQYATSTQAFFWIFLFILQNYIIVSKFNKTNLPPSWSMAVLANRHGPRRLGTVALQPSWPMISIFWSPRWLQMKKLWTTKL